MKRLLAWTLLAATLVLVPNLAMKSIAADITTMTNANFIFRSGGDLCSATLISKTERWVLTNQHCVDGAINTVTREEVQPDGSVKEIKRLVYDEITLSQPAYGPNGRVGELTLRAEILAFNKSKDLAVLRILSDTTPLTAAAQIAPDGYKLQQGQVVWAIGNPIGLENTVTRGVISHLYREIQIGNEKAFYLQTDAALAGGSSGGSLYSDDGYLVGIPSAGYRGTSLNFAIPYTVFKKFLADNGFARAWDPGAPSREEFLAKQAERSQAEKPKTNGK